MYPIQWAFLASKSGQDWHFVTCNPYSCQFTFAFFSFPTDVWFGVCSPEPFSPCSFSIMQLQGNWYILFVVTWTHNVSFGSLTVWFTTTFLLMSKKLSSEWHLWMVWSTGRFKNLPPSVNELHHAFATYIIGQAMSLASDMLTANCKCWTALRLQWQGFFPLYFSYSFILWFLSGCIEWQPDLLLTELQDQSDLSIWKLHSALFGFVQLNNAHNGKQLSGTLFKIVDQLGISCKAGSY